MLSRPTFEKGILINDATMNTVFRFFVSTASDQVVGHHVQCIDNVTGNIVHEHRAMSFLLECTINANTLTNGKEYRVRVRTYNADIASDFANENDNNTSNWSDYMMLKCFTKANVSIINIPIDTMGNRVVKNQTFTFEGTYSQKENVSLKSFRYILYDKDRVMLEAYKEVYQLDGILRQEIAGFKTDEEYFLELVTLNQYDIETRSDLIDFRVDYSPPRITQILQVANDEENALVKVDAQIVQMLLRGEGDYVFENYATYFRNRTIGEVNSTKFKDMDNMIIRDLAMERITEPLGRYDGKVYESNDLNATYSVTTDPSTIQDVFFINLENPNSSTWIDEEHGLNMDYYYTTNVWAESILEDKVFMTIEGKDGRAEFYISNGGVHCVEDYRGVKRHTMTVIERYAPNRPMHVFVQKRDTYMRLIARMV